jgi:hypothetical protein
MQSPEERGHGEDDNRLELRREHYICMKDDLIRS